MPRTRPPLITLATSAVFALSLGQVDDAHSHRPPRPRRHKIRIPADKLLERYDTVHVSRVNAVEHTDEGTTLSLETLHEHKGDVPTVTTISTLTDALHCKGVGRAFTRKAEDEEARLLRDDFEVGDVLHVRRNSGYCWFDALEDDPGDLEAWRAGWDAQRAKELRRKDDYITSNCMAHDADTIPGSLQDDTLLVYGKAVRPMSPGSFLFEVERAYVPRGSSAFEVKLKDGDDLIIHQNEHRLREFKNQFLFASLTRRNGNVEVTCRRLHILTERPGELPDAIEGRTSAPVEALSCGRIMSDAESAAGSNAVFHARIGAMTRLGSGVQQLRLSDVEVYKNTTGSRLPSALPVAWFDGAPVHTSGLFTPDAEALLFGQIDERGVFVLDRCGGSRHVSRPAQLDLGEPPEEAPAEATPSPKTSCAAAPSGAPVGPAPLLLALLAGLVSRLGRRDASR